MANKSVSTTPWESDSELAMVRDWFFPETAHKDPYTSEAQEDMRREAVARVNVWTFRSHKTPSAILATADLTDSILHYEELTRSGDVNFYRAVQFMFAFAFLRFVNAFVDRDTARTATASLGMGEDDQEDQRSLKIVGESSMYAHAAAIHMPSRFVDLRHQVSHGAVPELKTLKEAADGALTWLQERWWRTNSTGNPAEALQRYHDRRAQYRDFFTPPEAT